MLRQALKSHSHTEGELINRVRTYDAVANVFFLGRRRRVYRRIVGLSGAGPGDQVLDVGCNGGYLARIFAARVGEAGQVTGIDPAEPAIEFARRKAPGNCRFIVGEAQDLGLPDRSFDVVASTLAVHHIPEARRPAAFKEMFRVLRPGGTLLVADFRPSSGASLHAVPSGMRHINPDLLDGLARDAGFRIESRGDLPMLRYVQAVRPAEAGM
jgi:ubiquinone/menaquinone biosynthesis C-methylase UbiE